MKNTSRPLPAKEGAHWDSSHPRVCRSIALCKAFNEGSCDVVKQSMQGQHSLSVMAGTSLLDGQQDLLSMAERVDRVLVADEGSILKGEVGVEATVINEVLS
eukprot:2995449-Amphidinium_carterae.1